MGVSPGCGGCGGRPRLNAPWLCSDQETAISLYSPYPPFTTLLWLSLDSQEFLLLYLLSDWPACGKNAFCGLCPALSAYPEDAWTQLCWLAPSEPLPSHLIPTEHPSQPRHFNYCPLAFDFLTRIYHTTEIAILFSNIMSWCGALWRYFREMARGVCTEAVGAFL